MKETTPVREAPKQGMLSEEEAQKRLNAYVNEHGWPEGLTEYKIQTGPEGWKYEGGKLCITVAQDCLTEKPSDSFLGGRSYNESAELDPDGTEIVIATEDEDEDERDEHVEYEQSRHTVLYAFDPLQMTFEVTHNDDETIGIPSFQCFPLSVDYAITVEKAGDNLYTVKLPLFGEKWDVSTYAEAQKVARQRFPEIDFEGHVLAERENMEEPELIAADLDTLLDKLKEAWDEAMGVAE